MENDTTYASLGPPRNGSYKYVGPCFEELAYEEADGQTLDDVLHRAESLQCTARFAGNFELLLDLDSDEAFQSFKERWSWLSTKLTPGLLLEYDVLPSKSGNRHVIVKTGKCLDQTEQLLLQAVLGSDVRREALNYIRLHNTGDAKNCLFRPKPKQLTEGQ